MNHHVWGLFAVIQIALDARRDFIYPILPFLEQEEVGRKQR